MFTPFDIFDPFAKSDLSSDKRRSSMDNAFKLPDKQRNYSKDSLISFTLDPKGRNMTPKDILNDIDSMKLK